MSWIEVRAIFEPAPLDWSPMVDAFREHGIENTLEESNTLSGAIVDVEATGAEVAALKSLLEQLGATEVIVRPLEEVNWEEAWKQFFKPQRIGNRFVVRPTWEGFAAEPDDLVIVLDPGQAFGTGDHGTTRMCLALLEEYVKPGQTVMDLGCGSGILSIAAKMLGASRVLGLDIEPVSVEVSKENAARNNVDCEFETGDVLDFRPDLGWDIVVSNIISATLIYLSPDAYASVKEGGYWIVSGIIQQNWADVQKAAEKQGFKLVERREEIDWVSGVFQR